MCVILRSSQSAPVRPKTNQKNPKNQKNQPWKENTSDCHKHFPSRVGFFVFFSFFGFFGWSSVEQSILYSYTIYCPLYYTPIPCSCSRLYTRLYTPLHTKLCTILCTILYSLWQTLYYTLTKAGGRILEDGSKAKKQKEQRN